MLGTARSRLQFDVEMLCSSADGVRAGSERANGDDTWYKFVLFFVLLSNNGICDVGSLYGSALPPPVTAEIAIFSLEAAPCAWMFSDARLEAPFGFDFERFDFPLSMDGRMLRGALSLSNISTTPRNSEAPGKPFISTFCIIKATSFESSRETALSTPISRD
jgi:hypothetical protein